MKLNDYKILEPGTIISCTMSDSKIYILEVVNYKDTGNDSGVVVKIKKTIEDWSFLKVGEIQTLCIYDQLLTMIKNKRIKIIKIPRKILIEKTIK